MQWYSHNIAKWRGGTASLTHEQYRLYHVIIEQLYWEEVDIIPHIRSLAGMANMSERKARGTLAELVRLGKLSTDIQGRVSQSRAKLELEDWSNSLESAAKGGRKSGETRRKLAEQRQKLNKNNGTTGTPLPESFNPPSNTHTHTHTTHKQDTHTQEGSSESADARKIFSEWDFVSDDGSFSFNHDEIAAIEQDLPALKNIRGAIRQAARGWASELPVEQRKRAIRAHLAKKDQEARERQERAEKREREKQEHDEKEGGPKIARPAW